jgi:hypothetical protein
MNVRAIAILWLGTGVCLAAAGALEGDLKAKADAYEFSKMADGTVYLNLERAARQILGPGLSRTNDRGETVSNPVVPDLLLALAERLPEGAALHLGNLDSLVDSRRSLDLRKIRDRIVITGDGSIVLGGGQTGLQVLCGPGVTIQPAAEGRHGPLRDFTMLYGHCGRISGDVVDSSFIAAVNGWAVDGFKAEARIDNTLFLWFSINWTFAQYNAHLAEPSADWWKKNRQCYLDLKGGGKKTRIYLMIETNYGNPGTGFWLENADGVAVYHGATERGSSQGPGCYYLKNCTNVQLGLRRIFPGTRGGDNSAMPTHALTIEGGRGNILHFITDFANAYEESFVNSDPALQMWGAEFDFEVKGVESPDILKFAYTPFNNAPEGISKEQAAALAEKNAAKWVKQRAARTKAADFDKPENVAKLAGLIRSGRDEWWPLNATHEETFTFAGQDLTQGPVKRGGTPLPPPPSIPATDAPRTFRPLYFTQEADFGKALLDAGADPTGRKPSDDAFAQIMFGMKAEEVAACYEAVVKNQDRDAYSKLFPRDPKNKDKVLARVRRVEVPAGTFLLTRTLLFGPSRTGLLGAGPDKTILKVQGDIPAIKQFNPCGFYNFAIDGGRTGIEITGNDHGGGGLLQVSYVAGDNYYNLAFRNQSFAGMHIGADDPTVMGGAEHDQNRYVNLTFDHTGDYGIFMNHNMLDKWLLLNGEFTGQKKAGVSIKFNNLIHGGLYNCTFRDINGPGIDFMGGHPILGFRPYIVMVDQCQFIECGSESQPAVDYGYGELMSFTRTSIVTKNKKVKGGYIGAAQQVEEVNVDVALVEGAAALALRGVRNGATARANGHILKQVKANGPLVFVNDANSQNEMYRKSLDRHRAGANKTSANMPAGETPVNLNWDVNPSAHELAPPNGWVHPFLFYRCTLGDKTYAYSLVNADVDRNKILAEVDLSGLE